MALIIPISELPSAATLTGDEFFVVVQNGETRKVSLATIGAFLGVIVNGSVFYGMKVSADVLTGPQIAAGTQQAYVSGADITAPYNNSVGPRRHWAAWPVAEVGIVSAYVDDLNNSLFGTNGLFATPVQVGDYWFTQTNYDTELATVIFKH